MQKVGAYEAKTHLAQLLDQVEQGESILITRHGEPIARLSPVRGSQGVHPVDALFAARRGVRLEGAKVRDLIEEGRRR